MIESKTTNISRLLGEILASSIPKDLIKGWLLGSVVIAMGIAFPTLWQEP